MQIRLFNQGQRVKYCGDSLKTELRNQIGEVISHIKNGRGYVVDFSDGSYIIDDDNLMPMNFNEANISPSQTPNKSTEIDLVIIRKDRSHTEEEND